MHFFSFHYAAYFAAHWQFMSITCPSYPVVSADDDDDVIL